MHRCHIGLFRLSHSIPRPFLLGDLRQGQILNPTSHFLTHQGIDSDARLDPQPHLFDFHVSGQSWNAKPSSNLLTRDKHLSQVLSPPFSLIFFSPIAVFPVLRYNHNLFRRSLDSRSSITSPRLPRHLLSSKGLYRSNSSGLPSSLRSFTQLLSPTCCLCYIERSDRRL